RSAVPWVTDTVRKSGCLNDQICVLSALRMKFSQGPAMSVLSQTCLGTGLYERTSVKASSSHCSRRSKIIGTVLKSRRRGACARRFFNASRCVAPGGVNADSTAAAVGLARADATPTAPVAMVKAIVPNTSLLPVIIFMAVIYCSCLQEIGTGCFRDQ